MKKIIAINEMQKAEIIYDRIIHMWEELEKAPEDQKQRIMNAIVSHAVNRGEQGK